MRKTKKLTAAQLEAFQAALIKDGSGQEHHCSECGSVVWILSEVPLGTIVCLDCLGLTSEPKE
jgi:hypothetical protein